MGAVFLLGGLFIAAVGFMITKIRPETLLEHDRRTGRMLFASELRRSGSHEVALGAAARFYRRMGFVFVVAGATASVFGAVLVIA